VGGKTNGEKALCKKKTIQEQQYQKIKKKKKKEEGRGRTRGRLVT